MTISFSGLASGLDTSTWIESLVALKRAKVTVLQQEKEELSVSKDTLSSIKSFFATFRNAIQKITSTRSTNLVDLSLFAQNIATSANLNVLTANATSEAEEGTYKVKVDKLATKTTATSNKKYTTTITETTTATANTKLTNIGVTAGNIGVTVGGVKYGVSITNTDTIATFIEKLKNIGVEAGYNETTGVFTMKANASDIDDIDNTNIVNALHLTNANEGYETSNKLQVEKIETKIELADENTLLKDLGVSSGTFQIEANGNTYDIELNVDIQGTDTENDTLGELVRALQDNGIDARLSNGIFTINDAVITDEGTTGIISAMGLTEDVYTKSQQTKDLSLQVTVTTTTTATSETLLKDIGEGTAINADDTVIVKNSNGEETTITLQEDSTVGSLLTAMTNAGLYAAIKNDGTIEISGGTITGGSFNAIDALGLNSEPFTATATGNSLTETVVEHKIVDLQTKLVDDLGVTEGYLEVIDTDGNTYYEKIYSGQTIADFMADMGNLGIHTSLDEESGILTITGGEFATLSDVDVQALVDNLTIPETDSRYIKGTNLLECLYGAPVISTGQIEVASTYSRSRALTHSVTNLVNATTATTLGALGLNTEGTAEFNVRGDIRTIDITSTMTIQDLQNALTAQGIESSWDEDFSRLTINNATLEGGTSNVADVLNLEETIAGKYVTSNALYATSHFSIEATRNSQLSEFGVSGDEEIILHYEEGGSYTFTVNGTTTLGDLLDTINNNTVGTSATLANGIFNIGNGYITNATVETALGLVSKTTGTSHILSNQITYTVTTDVTGTSKLGDVISALGTEDKVAGGYDLKFKNTDLTVDENTTLNSIIEQINAAGGNARLDSTGRIHVEGGALTGTVAEALGFETTTITTAVSATGENLKTVVTFNADETTTLDELGITVNKFTNPITRMTQAEAEAAGYTWVTNADDLESAIRAGDSIVLGADIDLGSTTWDSLDYDGGEINGNGYVIKNLNNCSLLGTIYDSTIKNLGIENASITAAGTSGILAISSQDANIENCYIANSTITGDTIGCFFGEINNNITTITNSNIYNSEIKANTYGGGFIGLKNDYNTTLDIRDCGINAEISGTDSGIVIGYACGSTSFTNLKHNTNLGEFMIRGNYIDPGEPTTTNVIEDQTFGEFMDIYNSNGEKFGSINVSQDTTLGDIFDELKYYDINTSIKDGIITLESITGNYLEGDIAEALGIDKDQMTFIESTVTSGMTATSTVAVTYLSTVSATGTTTLNDLGVILVPTADGITGFANEVTRKTQAEAEAAGYTWVTDKAGLTTALTNGVNVMLGSDIDMSGSWSKINSYSGTFDGNGYILKNYNSQNYIFSTLSGSSTVQNVGFENASTNGPILAHLVIGTIDNCYIKDSSITTSDYSCGGLVDSNTGTISNINIINLNFTLNNATAGGIAGENQGIISNVKVINSNITSSEGNIGGISGRNKGAIENAIVIGCSISNTATTTGTGGIVGVSSLSGCIIKNSYVLDTIITSNINAGGILGHNNAASTIESCGTNAIVNAQSSKAGAIVGTIANQSSRAVTITNSSYDTSQGLRISGTTNTSLIKESGTNAYLGYQSNITVYNTFSDKIGTINLTGTSTINDIFSELATYGISGSINDGKIILTSADGNFISGDVAKQLGINVVESGTATSTTNFEQTSSSQVTYKTTINADGSDKISELGVYIGGFVNNVKQMTQAEAVAQGYIWVTTRAQLTSAMNTNKKIMLGSDIDLSDSAWTQISTFTGTLDGNGYVIKNMTFTADTSDYNGFVRNLDGTITNLGFENVTVSGYAGSGYATGVIAGNCIPSLSSSGEITNCYVKDATLNVDGLTVGGIAGYITSGCKSNAVINIKSDYNIKSLYGYDPDSGTNNNYYDISTGLSSGISIVTNYGNHSFNSTNGIGVSILDSFGNIVATLDIDNTTTINNMLAQLNAYGISGAISDGVIDLYSNDGYSVSGAVAEQLGLTVANRVTHTITVAATTSSTMAELGVDLSINKFTTEITQISESDCPTGYTWVTDRAGLTTALTNNDNIVLGADIDLSGLNWDPIDEYNGTLNGNGYVIRNMRISDNDDSYAGFIKNFSGRIENLGFENVNINSSSTTAYIGAIAGTTSTGNIYNCYIDKAKVSGGEGAGGFFGICNNMNIQFSTIYNSEIGTYNNLTAGGFAAKSTSGNNSIEHSNIYHSTVKANNNAGGLVGETRGTLLVISTEINTDIYAINAGIVAGYNNSANIQGAINRNTNIYNIIGSGSHNLTSYTSNPTLGDNIHTENLVVYDSSGEEIGNINIKENTTIGDIFNSLSIYGIAGEIDKNGIITLSSADGKTVNGNVAYQLGMSVSERLTQTITQVATTSSTLEELGVDISEDKFINSITRMTKAEADAAGYTWVTDRAELTTALNNNKNIVLGADIDLSGLNWDPIDQYNRTLNGNGYIIKNMTVLAEDACFIDIINSGGTVKNLGFENANVIASDSGGIIADYLVGNIENCYINNSNITGNYEAGGIVASSEGTINSCYIANTAIEGGYTGGIASRLSLSTVKNSIIYNVSSNGTSEAGGICYSSDNTEFSNIQVLANVNNVAGYAGILMGSDYGDNTFTDIKYDSTLNPNIELIGYYDETYPPDLTGVYKGKVEPRGGLNILDKNGNTIGNINTAGNTTIGNIFNSLAMYGITGSIDENGIITLSSTDGKTVSGTIADQLGLEVSQRIVQTISQVATTASTMAELGVDTISPYFKNAITRMTQAEAKAAGYTWVTDRAGLTTALTNNDNIVLGSDIDLAGEGWISKSYTGTFDGNGYVIKNMTVSSSSSGLFYSIGSGSVIKNLGFENANAKTGVLADRSYSYTIENCFVANSNIESTSSATGGLIGVNMAALISINSCNIINTNIKGSNTGGLVGSNNGTIIISNTDVFSVNINGSTTGGLVGNAGVNKLINIGNVRVDAAINTTGTYSGVLVGDKVSTTTVNINNILYNPTQNPELGLCGNTDATNATNISEGKFGPDSHIGIYDKTGEFIGDIRVNDNTSIGDIFTSLAAYGITGSIDENGIITLSSNDGKTVSGTIADQLGLEVSQRIVQTISQVATTASTMAELGVDTISPYFKNAITRMTQAEAEAAGYTWVTDRAGLTTALTNNKNIVLGSDIDLTREDWTSKSYTGTLDGNGYVIKNMTVSSSSGGLFYSIGSGSVIKNLGFENANAKTGVLADRSLGCTIENCFVANSNIESTSSATGGLIGASLNAEISINSCNIINTNIKGSNTGGLVGSNNGTINISNTDVFSVNINGSGSTGGLVGNAAANKHINISNVKVDATINTTGTYSGVLVGNKLSTTTVNIDNILYNPTQNPELNLCGNTDATSATNISEGKFRPDSHIRIYDKTGEFITDIRVNDNTSIGDIFTSLAVYGITGSIDENGVISLNSTNGNYVSGKITDQLGVQAVDTGSSIIVGATATSSEAITYTKNIAVNSATTLGELNQYKYQIDSTISLAEADDNVISISTVDDLQLLANLVNAGNTMAGKTFVLTDDIDLSTVDNWTSIGGYSSGTLRSFSGTFDGQGYTISNLTQNSEITTSNGATETLSGLFGYVDGATIKNLTLSNVNITTVNNNSSAYPSRVGALIGQMATGTVSGITVENLNLNAGANSEAGGIIGMANAGTILNSSVSGTISCQIGAGILGRGGIWSGNLKIDNCQNNANITSTGNSGGIAGLIQMERDVEITNVLNKGTITSSYNAVTAGIIGNITSYSNRVVKFTLTNAVNIAKVTNSTSTSRDIMYAAGALSASSTVTIANCYGYYTSTTSTSSAIDVSNWSGVTLGTVQNNLSLSSIGTNLRNSGCDLEKWSLGTSTSALNLKTGDDYDIFVYNSTTGALTEKVDLNAGSSLQYVATALNDRGDVVITGNELSYVPTYATMTVSGTGAQILNTPLNITTTDTITSNTTLKDLELNATNYYMTIKSHETDSQEVYTLTSEHTLGDIQSILAAHDISSNIVDGKLTIYGNNDTYIAGLDSNIINALNLGSVENLQSQYAVMSNTSSNNLLAKTESVRTQMTSSNLEAETVSVKTQMTSSNLEADTVSVKTQMTSDELEAEKIHSSIHSNTIQETYTAGFDTTFDLLGINNTNYITINSNGIYNTITIESTDTIGEMLSALAGYGIVGSIDDGKITIKGNKNDFVAQITDELASKIKLDFDESTFTHDVTYTNTHSDFLGIEGEATLNNNTTFAELGATDDTYITVVTAGTEHVITVQATNTVGEIVNALGAYGIAGSIKDGKVTLTPTGFNYIKDMSDDLANWLHFEEPMYSETIGSIGSATTSPFNEINTLTAQTTTELQYLQDEEGNTPAGYDIEITTESGSYTYTFAATDTIQDVIDKLKEYGITATLNPEGRFDVESSTMNFDIAGNLGTFLMGEYNKIFDKTETINTSTTLSQETEVKMNDSTILSDIEITDGNLEIRIDNEVKTITIDSTSTIADFRIQLANLGLSSSVINGQLSIITDKDISFSVPAVDGSNIIDILELNNKTSETEYSQTSKWLGDSGSSEGAANIDTLLSEIKDVDGNLLGITAGKIYVYQDGTRSAIDINTNDSLRDLASKLSQYGISMGISSEGKLYFDGNNNSYLTTDGLASGDASNILTKLGIETNWNTRYNSTSETLDYEQEEDTKVNGSTKLVDLQGSDGSDLGITEGNFYVYQNGVRNTESIGADTTVNDFIATLSTYGITATFDENGSLAVGADSNTYLATSATSGDDTNLVDVLFEEWNFTNIYTSNGLDIPTDVTVSISKTTKLADINEGTYQAGYITVIKDGVQTNIELTQNDTVGDLIDELALYGFESVINANGQLIIKNTGNSLLQTYSGSGTASNALELLGIGIDDWISTNTYESDALSKVETVTNTVGATRDTLLSELGVTKTGEYYIYNNGVKYTALISSDETVGSLMDTLNSFGLETSLTTSADGSKSIIKVLGNGNAYVAESTNDSNKSDVIEKIFDDASINSTLSYRGLEETSKEVHSMVNATEDTLLSTYDDIANSKKAEGNLSINIDGNDYVICIEADETIGSLVNKFKALGLEANYIDGNILIQSGYKDFTVNTAGTDSSLLETIGLVYKDNLGNYLASNSILEETTTTVEDKTLSVANYANDDTTLDLLNITSGTLSIYRNGEKATITIDSTKDFAHFKTQVSTCFGGDVKVEIGDDGYLTFDSDTPDVRVEVGTTTDTSNFATVTGITNDGSGIVKSARELYCVNSNSKITTSGIFRGGDVKAGTFTIGGANFEITDDTTIANIVSQINASQDAKATAYWDSVDGKLVIQSRTTGSALINIEAGKSNFTDIMGFTNSEWADADSDGKPDIGVSAATITKLDTSSQEIGDNARFSINGTYYTSTSNTIGSDISRIKGVTINLKGISENGEETTITIERDKETVANAVSDVVDAYNTLIEGVDKEIAKGAPLDDQFTLKLLRNQIRNMMTSTFSNLGSYVNLNQIGISVDAASANNINTDRVDVLTFDKNKFFEAYDADRDSLKLLLVGTETDKGLFKQIENTIDQALTSYSGYFNSANRSYNNQIQRLDDKIQKAQKAVDKYKERLEAKFASMELLISQLQNQYSSFLGV